MISDLLQARSRNRSSKIVNDKKVAKKKYDLVKIKAKIKYWFSREMVDELEEDGKLLLSLASFFGLLLVFMFEMVWKGVKSIKLTHTAVEKVEQVLNNSLGAKFEKLIARLESKRGGVKRSFLIALAFRNMKIKLTRSFVTVGGMALGIGAIVFLVSLGYGLQNVVVSRVAKLDELLMADITLGSASNLKIDKESLSRVAEVEGVSEVMPIVSLVGRVNFGGGVGESVVYGVTRKYLEVMGLRKLEGEYFESDEIAWNNGGGGVVAGVQDKWDVEPATYGRVRSKISFNVEEGTWLRVRSGPSVDSEVIGYLKRVTGGLDGTEVWGGKFLGDKRGQQGETAEGVRLGLWVSGPFPIWEKVGTEEYAIVEDEYGLQEWREGYVAEWGVIVDEAESRVFETVYGSGSVLGEATESANLADTDPTSSTASLGASEATISATVVGVDEQGVEWVEIEGESAGTKKAEINVISADEVSVKKAVVNSSFLKLLGFELDEAVGKAIGVKFVILSALKPDVEGSAETEEIQYEIVAVIDDGDSPVMYVPFEDLDSLGIVNYSQAKLMVEEKGELAGVREEVDTMGFSTSSVADTVERIDQLFASVRMVLATFGFVALAVASLGMFNTLTVSLMERTREVGVMKAMGMKSYEVRELFLAEAMVMGILGGVFGVLLGVVAGKLLSLLLSIFSIMKGVGWIDISYVPPGFILFVLVLSFIVGVVTGIYPARRATRISALDALRYE